MKSVRTPLAIAMMALSVGHSYAQVACPLTNTNLTDLRAAAARLASNVVLSANCQAYQDTINQSTQQLRTLATQIQSENGAETFDLTNASDVESQQRQNLAIQTIQQLNNISSVFRNERCGQEAASFLDYAGAFTDMVTSVSPFLALYGGAAAAPWVLGTSIGGATAKMVVGFFKGRAVDMRKADQSAAFIKNSCSFYAFNQVKTSLDDLQLGQIPRLQVQLNAAKDAANKIDEDGPEMPSVALLPEFLASEKDKEKITALQTRLAADPMEACAYIGRYARGEDTNGDKGLVERNWDVYVGSIRNATTNLEWERHYFMEQLNTVLSAPIEDTARCQNLATRWINKMLAVVDAGQAAARRTFTENANIRPYLAWRERRTTQATLVTNLEARLRFFNMVTGPGFNIEYSEIIRDHQQVQDTLFQTYRFLSLIKMKGLAEAWLKVKQEDANHGLSEMLQRKKNMDERLKKLRTDLKIPTGQPVTATAAKAKVDAIGMNDMCNQLRRAWSSWYGGLIHAQAGRDYCVAFEDVIDRLDYPTVQGMCFRNGGNSLSLAGLVRKIQAARPVADELLASMRALECRQAAETTNDLIKLNFAP